MLIVGEVVCAGGQDLWELLVLSAQFFCDSKTFIKNKMYFKKELHIKECFFKNDF